MGAEASPPVSDEERRAVLEAFWRLGVRLGGGPAAYGSRWREIGLREAAELDEPEDYTPSPRSTRGATRA